MRPIHLMVVALCATAVGSLAGCAERASEPSPPVDVSAPPAPIALHHEPRPLVDEQGGTTIGPDGGKLCAGHTCVALAAGAVDERTEIQAHIVPGDHSDEGFEVVGDVVEISADKNVFDDQQMEVHLPHVEGHDHADVTIAFRVDERAPWVPLRSQPDPHGTSHFVKYHHFSQWALGKVKSNVSAASGGVTGLAIDSKGAIHFTVDGDDRLGRLEKVGATTPTYYGPSQSSDMKGPRGVAVHQDKIYVNVDSGVVRIDDIQGNGHTLLRAFPFPGSQNGLAVGSGVVVRIVGKAWRLYQTDLNGAGFQERYLGTNAAAIAMNPSGDIYLSIRPGTPRACQILKLKSLQDPSPESLGRCGSDRLQFGSPEGIAVDSAGRIYVADRTNRRVVRVDDITGAGWEVIYEDPARGPTAIALGPGGSLIVGFGNGDIESLALTPPPLRTWLPLGPSGLLDNGNVAQDRSPPYSASAGRVHDVAISRDGQRVYMTSHQNGVWKSTDGGGSWTQIYNAKNWETQPIGPIDYNAIALVEGSSGASDTIYVGLGVSTATGLRNSERENQGRAVAVSRDSGATWRRSVVPGYVRSFAVDPSDSRRLMGCGDGVYRLESGTWTLTGSRISTPQCFASSSSGTTTWFATHPVNSIASPKPPLLRKSTDYGRTWNPVTVNIPDLASAQLVRFVATPNDPDTLFLFAGKGDKVMGIYRYKVSTRTSEKAEITTVDVFGRSGYDVYWETGWTNPYYARMVVDPTGQYLYMATDFPGVFRTRLTDNAGKLQGALQILRGSGFDAYTLKLTPGNPDQIWVGGDHGLYMTPRAQSFTSTSSYLADFVLQGVNRIITGSLSLSIAQHPTSAALVLSGSQDTGAMLYGGGVWRQLRSGDQDDPLFNWRDPYEVLSFTYLGGSGSFRLRIGSKDEAHKLAPPVPPGEELSAVQAISPYDAANPQGEVVIALGGSARPYLSMDFGRTWTAGGGRTDSPIAALTFASRSRLYAGTNNGSIYRYDWSGSAWDLTPIDTTNLPDKEVVRVAVENSRVYAIPEWRWGANRGPQIWKYDGSSWQGVSQGLPDRVQFAALAVDPASPEHLYAGGDRGVWRSTDGGASWHSFSAGMPEAIVQDLQFHPSKRLLRASTWGRGVWEMVLDPQIPDRNVRLNIQATALDHGLYPVEDGLADPLRPGEKVDYRQSPAIKVSLPGTTGAFPLPEQIDSVQFFNELEDQSKHKLAQQQARLYVNVRNRGTQVADAVSVTLLRAEVAGATMPALPADLAGSVAGSGTVTGAWKSLGVRKLDGVKAALPGVVSFDVPVSELRGSSGGPVALLALAHQSEDPFVSTETDPRILVLESRHVAMRQVDLGTTCNGRFVDLKTDPDHCGQCNTACGVGQTCFAGQCGPITCKVHCNGDCCDHQPGSECRNTAPTGSAPTWECVAAAASTSPTCKAPRQTKTGKEGDPWRTCSSLVGIPEFCVDITKNRFHCGGCNQLCEYTCWDKQCIDTTKDARYCGARPNPNDPTSVKKCSGTRFCNQGECTASCDAGWMMCTNTALRGAPYCAQTDEDPDNCGTCGRKCAFGERCVGGLCTCDPGLQSCEFSRSGASTGAVNQCAAVQTNAFHCGACADLGAGAVEKAPSCVDGTSACKFDRTHRYERNWPPLASCEAGQCRSAVTTDNPCESGQLFCDKMCVDGQTNPTRCGDCSTSCGAGKQCLAGTCTALTCPSKAIPCNFARDPSPDDHWRWADGTYGESCQDYHRGHGQSGANVNGIYLLRPDASKPPFPVYCDMQGTTVGTGDPALDGGWTLVGRELAGEQGAMRLLDDVSGVPLEIAKGTGSGSVGPSLGGAYSQVMVRWGAHWVRFDVTDDIFVSSFAPAQRVTQVVSSHPIVNWLFAESGGADRAGWFCRVNTRGLWEAGGTLFGDSSWGLTTQRSTERACGCNGNEWRGEGLYYGGATPEDRRRFQPPVPSNGNCPDGSRCLCHGGSWSGLRMSGDPNDVDDTGYKKGHIFCHHSTLWVR